MITLHRRYSRLAVLGLAIAGVAGLAACGADATSPTTPVVTGTNSQGHTISLDVGVDTQKAAGTTVSVKVHVRTATGTPVVGDTVKWNVATGGGSLSALTSITDVNGGASVDWTLGKLAGPNSLGANITGAAVAVTATGTVGPLAMLAKQNADSQIVAATGSVLLTVKSADQFGNAVPNVDVTWTTSGGTLAPLTSKTGTSGNAQVTLTTPKGVARYTVTATSAGLPVVTYIISTF